MTDAETHAIEIDASDKSIKAIQAYERAIQVGGAQQDTYINLAILYFECLDYGYATAHSLNQEFVDRAWVRSNQLLDAAEHQFGPNVELSFWRRYFAFVVLGEPPFYKQLEKEEPFTNNLIPYFYLYNSPGGDKFKAQASQLLQLVKQAKNSKQRYIKSVLETQMGVLKPPPL